jgi:hypothetical protein
MTASLFNLLICHVPGRQDVSDFHTIRNIMNGRAPDIDVHILSVGAKVPTGFWRTMAMRPTLIFSPMPVQLPAHANGARLVQEGMSKLEEVEQLASAGIPVPETRLITPDFTIEEATWGPSTVVKPNHGFRGQGIELRKTRDVRWIDTSALPVEDPRHGKVLLAQRYIDTGPYANSYRVMTVLGHPIYCMMSQALEKHSGAVAVNDTKRAVSLVNEPAIVELAREAHAKLPQVPVMGIDIIREHATSQLFVLEFNSFGATWHLSSDHGRKYQRNFGLDCYGQFDALNTITDALIETTRKQAV